MNVLEKILEEIDKTEENYSHRGHSPTFLKGACNMYADVKGIIRSHMDEVPDTNIGDWIPVSERLPEMPEENPILDNKPLEIYIVDIGEHYPFRAFWNGKNFTDGWNILKVIAWKPLPEPYKEENHD